MRTFPTCDLCFQHLGLGKKAWNLEWETSMLGSVLSNDITASNLLTGNEEFRSISPKDSSTINALRQKVSPGHLWRTTRGFSVLEVLIFPFYVSAGSRWVFEMHEIILYKLLNPMWETVDSSRFRLKGALTKCVQLKSEIVV